MDDPAYAEVRAALEGELQRKLAEIAEIEDAFAPGMTYIRQWGYTLDETGTVPYTW